MAKYQAYAEYQDSGVEWLGEIPTHWDVQPTKRFFRLIAEPAPENNDYELLSVYTEIGVKPRKELEQKGNKASTTDGYWLVKKGDIVVNKLLAWMGAVGYSEYDGVTSPAYDILRPTKKLNPKFYHYLFRTKIANMEFKRWSRGIMEMRLRLYFDELGRITMPFPTSKEQNEIVNFLDHETTKIDHLIEKQQQLIELLKEKRQAVISHAVTKGLDPNVQMKDSGVEWLGEVPEHWSVKKLKYIVDLVGEKVESSNKQYVGMENISSKSGVFLQTEGILPEGISNTFNKGDILFGKLRPYLAKCWLADFSGICSSEFLVLRSKNKLSPIFLNLFLLTDQFIDQVNSSTYGSKMPRANWEFIGDLPIPVPDEQSSIDIANFLERQTQKYDSLIIKVSQQIALMQERRTALISAAVTGKIDVRHWQSPTVAETQTELSA